MKNGYTQEQILSKAECVDYCDCSRVKNVVEVVLELLAGALLVFAVPESLLLGWIAEIAGALRFIPGLARLEQLLKESPGAVKLLEKVRDEVKELLPPP